ncbi:MAG TPA: 3',5'-cyclic-AMP phosphodiesterase [Cellvibrionaceae bacterium]
MAAKATSVPATGKPVRLIQITDSHLGAEDGAQLLGLNTDQSLVDVLELINAEQANYAAVVCTGDIASDPIATCYTRFLDTLHQHFDCPIGWLPGNHDLTSVMAALEHPYKPASRTMSVGGWHIVLLDTSVPGHVYGELSEDELTFLNISLEANAHLPTLVLLHHQPIPVGSAWIDQYIVRNHPDFFAIIDRHPQVKAVSWGHVHQSFEQMRGQVQLLATPSTCVQFKPNSDDFAVDIRMPGYRWLDLYPDGRLQTGVSRVRDKTYMIDYRSAGY